MIIKKKNFKLIICYSIIVTYCLGLSPLFLSHDHDHDSDTDHYHISDSSFCESISQDFDSYLACSHEEHLSKTQKECLLCDHSSFYGHYEFVSVLNWSVQLPSVKNEQLSLSIFSQDLTNFNNKSPPFIS
jgi:hypothetical protein